MVAQLPPVKSRELDASAAAHIRAISDLGRGSNHVGRDQPSAVPARELFAASLKEVGERNRPRPVTGSASDALLVARDMVSTLSVERVSVVDGADRMAYSETRDRKGWKQPLVAREALSDAGRRGGGDRAHSGEGACIVLTFEGQQERHAAIPRAGAPASPTRYTLGKERVVVKNHGRASQLQSSARQQPLQTVRETPTIRARTR